jgi:hypothetical protein
MPKFFQYQLCKTLMFRSFGELLIIARIASVLSKRSIDRNQNVSLLMKPFVKNIELQQRDSIRCKIVTEEFFEDENIIRIRSLIMVEH